MKKLILSMVMILGCAVLSVGAYGDTLQGQLDVSVNAVAACTMSVTGITFPDYVGLQVTANGDVTVTCAQTIPYTITLDAGLNALDSLIRHVSAPNAITIGYHLLQDAGLTVPWGDTGFGDTILYPPLSDTGSGIAQPHTVYGALTAGGAVPPGLYTDTVTVSVDY